MEYVVYILRSLDYKRYYIGHSKNINRRLSEHNSGSVKSTKAYLPWEIIYEEKFKTKSNAYRRELQIKSFKSGNAFHKLLKD
ncbi:MAG: GIY-YIG nuclease family protein [Ignavibacteriae bacterium]|nr:GIY-YIG nuclease family protein [Ignavibacteriota bacterium]NOG98800.1 GIY-YIG nuclease family protein [Ignavibacteriota bacterium]